jgi:hypothetical protein
MFMDLDSGNLGLRYLPVRKVPPMVNMQLRVLASREQARRITHRNFRTWLAEVVSKAWLFFDNLLKPLAVPAVGGLLASTLCFGMIVDTLHLHGNHDWQDDIPLNFSSDVGIGDVSPFSIGGQAVLVQLCIDSKGQVTDYTLPFTPNPSAAQLHEIGNLVLFSTFTPAMRMGRPVASKKLFYLDSMNVKG